MFPSRPSCLDVEVEVRDLNPWCRPSTFHNLSFNPLICTVEGGSPPGPQERSCRRYARTAICFRWRFVSRAGKSEPALLCGWVCMQEPDAFRPLEHVLLPRIRSASLPVRPVPTDKRLRKRNSCRYSATGTKKKKRKEAKTTVYVTQKRCSYVQSDPAAGGRSLFQSVGRVQTGVSVRLFIYSCLNRERLSVCSRSSKSGQAESCTTGLLGSHFMDVHSG